MDAGLIDSSVPHIGVLMEKSDTREYPRYALPAGYAFSYYQPGLESQWAALQYGVGQTDSLEEAEAIFQNDFAGREALAGRMLFVLDRNSELAGTGCLWDGVHFGKTLQRLHWIAVSPPHQGRGIAKAIVSRLLDIYNAIGVGDYIYLTSQTESWRALHMYAGFGFKPYMGERPVNWRCDNFAQETAEAWRMIFEKINLRE